MWRGGREPAGRRAEAARCPGGGPAAGRRAKAEQLSEGRRRRRRRPSSARRGRVSGERRPAPRSGAHPRAWRTGSRAADPGPSRRGVGMGLAGPRGGELRGSGSESSSAGAAIPPRPGLPARGERRRGGGGGGRGEPGRARGGSVGSLRREERLRDGDGGPGRPGGGGGERGGGCVPVGGCDGAREEEGF